MDFDPEITLEAQEQAQALRPGFLIRHLHQLHMALFAEECAEFAITSVQYSVLSVILERPGLEQWQIGEAAGIERIMLTKTLARLVAAGLLKRTPSRLDRRQNVMTLTPQGQTLLARMQAPVSRADARTLASLAPGAREVFMECLEKLADAGANFRRARPRLK